MRKSDDSGYIGKKFGKWTVLEVGIPKSKHYAWRCRCECGAESLVVRENALRGMSRGCLKCRSFSGEKNPMWRGHGSVPQQYYGILLRSAKVRGMAVNVSIKDLDRLWKNQGGKCALSGLPIVLATKKSGCTASLDRVDSSVGYEIDNIQWVHKDINKMKNNIDQDLFLSLCATIVLHLIGAPIEL